MTRTGPADVVMSAYDLTASGRSVIGLLGSGLLGSGLLGSGLLGSGLLGSGWAGCRQSAFARAPFPGPPSFKPAHHRLADRSGRLRPVCPPPRPQSARAAHSPHPPPPAQAHSLYAYLPGWHTAPLYGWSFDPGRDILCILLSPPRWLQWP